MSRRSENRRNARVSIAWYCYIEIAQPLKLRGRYRQSRNHGSVENGESRSGKTGIGLQEYILQVERNQCKAKSTLVVTSLDIMSKMFGLTRGKQQASAEIKLVLK